MSRYDYIAMWNTAAAAKADLAIAADLLPDDFNVKQFVEDHCIKHLQIWRASQDTVDADGNVIHTYIAGPGAKFAALISLTSRSALIENAAATQLGLDRDKMNARQSGFVVLSNTSGSILQDIRFQPVFMGMEVPWGGLD